MKKTTAIKNEMKKTTLSKAERAVLVFGGGSSLALFIAWAITGYH